ncbi:beta-ketoacyl-[acyl-carrier-protein] synthase family protein [Streptomyces sp. NPDC054933]
MILDITGMGAVASVGSTPEEIHSRLCQGRLGLAEVTAFDLSGYRQKRAYPIADRPVGGSDVPQRATGFLHTAVRQALADAGIADRASSCPVLVGTTHREQRSVELWWRDGYPVRFPDLGFDAGLRAEFGFTDTYTFANACSASLTMLGMAQDLIEHDLADTVVVAGTDVMTESTFGAFDRIQNVPDQVRPFDRSRKGMMMGEGAVAVVLERPGPDRTRTRARLRGVGMNCDASHATAPNATSVEAAVVQAHQRAGIAPDDVGLVMLHGTGTVLNDQTEAAVLHSVFGRVATQPMLTAIKSMTGHTLGGSGLLSLVTATLSMRRGLVPPTAGLDELMDEAKGLDLVHGQARAAEVSLAQINAIGMGGLNAIAIVEGVAA